MPAGCCGPNTSEAGPIASGRAMSVPAQGAAALVEPKLWRHDEDGLSSGERRADNGGAGSRRRKSTRGEEPGGSPGDGDKANEIVAMIAPGPKDIVIRKQKPSGFFGTNLASYLTLLGCDSVIVVGTTT